MKIRVVLPSMVSGLTHYTAGGGLVFSYYIANGVTAIRLFDVDGENLIVYKERFQRINGQVIWRYHLLGKNAKLNYVKQKEIKYTNSWNVNEGTGSGAYLNWTIDGNSGDSDYTAAKNTIIWDTDWLNESEMSEVTIPQGNTLAPGLWQNPMGRMLTIPTSYSATTAFSSTILGPDNYAFTYNSYNDSAMWLRANPKGNESRVNYQGTSIPVSQYGMPCLMPYITDNFFVDPKTAEAVEPFETIQKSITAYGLVSGMLSYMQDGNARECAPRAIGSGKGYSHPWYDQNDYRASYDYTFTNNFLHPIDIIPESYEYFQNACIMGVPVTEDAAKAAHYVETGELPDDAYQIETDDDTGLPYTWQGDPASDTSDKSHIDDMELPNPTKGGMVSGSNRYYLVTEEGMANFLHWFWYDLGTLEQVIWNFLTSMYGNLKECIISYQYFPCSTSALGGMSGNTSSIMLGNLDSDQDAYELNSLPSNVLLGTIDISTAYEHFGDFLDWEGYTNFQIYLPYAGIFDLPTKSVQNKVLKVYYVVDVPSGALQYTLKVFADNESENGFVVLQTSIPFGESISISLQDAMQTKTALLQSTVNAAIDIASMTVGLHTGSAIASSVTKGVAASYNIEKGIATASQQSGNNSNSNNIQNRSSDVGFNTGQVAHDLLQFKSDLPSAVGQTNGLIGKWSPWSCYLLVDRPIEYRPENYGKYVGYLYYKYNKLSNMKGYTTCLNPQISFTTGAPLIKEIEEIYSLLQMGVIL